MQDVHDSSSISPARLPKQRKRRTKSPRFQLTVRIVDFNGGSLRNGECLASLEVEAALQVDGHALKERLFVEYDHKRARTWLHSGWEDSLSPLLRTALASVGDGAVEFFGRLILDRVDLDRCSQLVMQALAD
jgi:hypothetical protein